MNKIKFDHAKEGEASEREEKDWIQIPNTEP